MKRIALVVAILAGLVAGNLFAQGILSVDTGVVSDLSVHHGLTEELTSMLALSTGGGTDVAPAIAAKATAMLATYTDLTAAQANQIRQCVGDAYLQSGGYESRGASWFADILTNSTTGAADYAIRRHAKMKQGICTGATGKAADMASAVTLLDAAFDLPKADETVLTREDWEICKWWGKYANGGTWTGTASAAILETNLVLNATATSFATDYPRNDVLAEVVTGKFRNASTGAWSITGTAAATNANVYLTAHPFDADHMTTSALAVEGWLLLQDGGDIAAARAKFKAAFDTLATEAGDPVAACELLAALPTNLFGEQNHVAWIAWLKTIRTAVPSNTANATFLAQLNGMIGHE